MQNLINFSEAVNLAFHTVGILAGSEETYVRTSTIAELLDVSEHHLQKVHQRLAKMGIVRAVRGPKGGFCLNKPANSITLLEIYEAMEGPLHPNRCLLGRPNCQRQNCLLGTMVDQVNAIVLANLRTITVDQLAPIRNLMTPPIPSPVPL